MTITDIANSALTKIGTQPIMSLDDDNKRAKLVKNRIYSVIEVVLRMHPWNCATKRVVLSPLAGETPAYTYEYVHQLPSDCLRVLEINPVNLDDYRIEGRQIITDTDEVNLKYIKDMNNDVDEIDSMTAEAIALYLAWDLAFPIVQNRALKEDIWDDFEMILKRAKSIDAKEDPPLEIEADLFIESREASSSGPLRANR